MFLKSLPALLFLLLLSNNALIAQSNSCEKLNAAYADLPELDAFNSILEIFKEVGDSENAIFILQQKMLYYPDEAPEENGKLLRKLQELKKTRTDTTLACAFPGRVNWSSAQGPPGADATSFFMDSDGGYWLGTGSSGGVFYSANSGKSWEVRNEGIGPWHISNMMEYHDTLFIKVNLKYGGKNGDLRFYYWEKESSSWIFCRGEIDWYPSNSTGPAALAQRRFIELENEVEISMEQSALNLTTDNYAKYSYAGDAYLVSKSYGFSDYLYAEPMAVEARIFGYKELNSELANLNIGFPRDMFYLIAGNEFNIGKGSSILLSKSGPYLNKKNKSIKPLPTTGLIASDIRESITTKEGLFALVNEADIWKYENGNWSESFNAYEHHMEMKDPISRSGYETRNLNAQKDGSILFSFCGDIWQLNADGSSSAKELNLKGLLDQGSDQLYALSSAGYDQDGKLYVTIINVEAQSPPKQFSKDDYYATGGILISVDKGKAEIVRRSGEQLLLINDKAGDLWLKDGGELESLSGYDTTINLGYYDESLIIYGFTSKGELIVKGDDEIYRWDRNQKKWISIAKGFPIHCSSITMDANGTLFMGTGDRYQEGCGGGSFHGYSSGVHVWKEDHWEAIIGGVNTWILSLAATPNNGIAVGTSGSGVQFLKLK